MIHDLNKNAGVALWILSLFNCGCFVWVLLSYAQEPGQKVALPAIMAGVAIAVGITLALPVIESLRNTSKRALSPSTTFVWLGLRVFVVGAGLCLAFLIFAG